MPKPSQSLSDPAASTDTPQPDPVPEDPQPPRDSQPSAPQPRQDDGEDQDDVEPEEESSLDPAEVLATVEAILFATDTSLSPAKIAQVGELPGRRIVKQAVEQLNERYDRMGCAFRIDRIAGGYQMLTREEYHDVLSRLLKVKSDSRLSQAAMETLAVVAYRQPIIRADVEAIRGVACGDMIRKLMEKGLVKIVGRAEVLGRPMLYGTTRRFLETFGLNSIEDLPRVEELRRPEQQDAGQQSSAERPSEEDGEPPASDSQNSRPEPPPQEEESAPGDSRTRTRVLETAEEPSQPACDDVPQDDDPKPQDPA